MIPRLAHIYILGAVLWTALPAFASEKPALRDLAAAKSKGIGAAVDVKALQNDPVYAQILTQQFNVLTPENALKMDWVQKKRGQFDFRAGDMLADLAQKNGMTFKGHTLVWFRALPEWLTEQTFTKEELKQIMHDHIKTVVTHYKGRVQNWDVVNEAINDDGSYRHCIWYDVIGPEYIELAFRWARAYDPNVLLYYNDYDAEVPNQKSDAIYLMLKDLKAKGVPIDGIGFQAHVRVQNPPNVFEMDKNLKRFAQLGLFTDFTEIDVSIIHDPNRNAIDLWMRQAEVFGNFFKACINNSSCTMAVLWGFTDKYTWKRDFDPSDAPLIFDAAYKPKPAFDVIAGVFNE